MQRLARVFLHRSTNTIADAYNAFADEATKSSPDYDVVVRCLAELATFIEQTKLDLQRLESLSE